MLLTIILSGLVIGLLTFRSSKDNKTADTLSPVNQILNNRKGMVRLYSLTFNLFGFYRKKDGFSSL